jgi:hypothetical protein
MGLAQVATAVDEELWGPPPEREPRPGIYTGADLVIRVDRWFRERYGKKLEAYWGPGRLAFEFRGATWILRYPFAIAPNGLLLHTSSVPPKSPDGGPEPLNVLEYILDFPAALGESLSREERGSLVETFRLGWEALNAITDVDQTPLVKAAVADHDACVASIAGESPNLGQARWSALQAAEKAMKAVLLRAGRNPPRSHDLSILRPLAAAEGADIPQALVDVIQCRADVRYGDDSSTIAQAIEAHHGSVRVLGICSRVLG